MDRGPSLRCAIPGLASRPTMCPTSSIASIEQATLRGRLPAPVSVWPAYDRSWSSTGAASLPRATTRERRLRCACRWTANSTGATGAACPARFPHKPSDDDAGNKPDEEQEDYRASSDFAQETEDDRIREHVEIHALPPAARVACKMCTYSRAWNDSVFPDNCHLAGAARIEGFVRF